MTADRTWMEKLGFDLEDKGTTTPLWVVVDDCGGERPASLAEVVLWTYLTTPAVPVAPTEPVKYTLTLPDGDTRTARVVFSERKGDTIELCVALSDAAPVAPAVPDLWRREVGAMARSLAGCADSAPADSHPDTMRQVASRLFRLLTNAAPVAPATPVPPSDEWLSEIKRRAPNDFIVRTNADYSEWCKTYYVPESLDDRGMRSIDGLWAWQEQERRKMAAPVAPTCKGKNCGSTDGIHHSRECHAEHERAYMDTAGNRNPDARYAGYLGHSASKAYTPDERAAWEEGRFAQVGAPVAPAGLHLRAADAIESLLLKIRRDAPELSGKIMGRAEAVMGELRAAPTAPADAIDMVLHCPACGRQHVDAPDREDDPSMLAVGITHKVYDGWTNPPHRSHLCHSCGHIWRPADVSTNGVKAIKTIGKADSPVAAPVAPADLERMRHIANEWADMATSCHQWLRNIVDWISTPADALANSTRMLQHCRNVNDAPATPPDTRKPCTCDGAGRGPGRECVVQAGGRLGELWRCAKGHEPVQVAAQAVQSTQAVSVGMAACDASGFVASTNAVLAVWRACEKHYGVKS